MVLNTPPGGLSVGTPMMKRTKPILRWPGGKSRALKHLLPLLRPHRIYVEAFGGGLALLLAKDRSPTEVVNDINSDLVNLYRHAQFHLEALISEVEWMVNSRENLEDVVAQPGLTGLQQAARFLMRNRMSFGGAGEAYAVTKQAQPSRAGVLQLLRDFNARLDKVSVENLPFERLFALYDSPETLWFLDPPYSAGEVSNYGLWSEADMGAFAERVHGLSGDWIVTVNDSPGNRALFRGHEITPLVTPSGAGNRRARPAATFAELVIRRHAQKAIAAGRPLRRPRPQPLRVAA